MQWSAYNITMYNTLYTYMLFYCEKKIIYLIADNNIGLKNN